MIKKRILLGILCLSMVASFFLHSPVTSATNENVLDSLAYRPLTNSVGSFDGELPFDVQLLSSSTAGSLVPELVTSIEEMTDPKKLYVLDGYIYQYKKMIIPVEPINEIERYGYEKNFRMIANGTTTAYSGVNTTNLIPAKSGDVVIFDGYDCKKGVSMYICMFDANKKFVKSVWIAAKDNGIQLSTVANKWAAIDSDLLGFTFTLTASSMKFTSAADIEALNKTAYIRISSGSYTGDEEIYVNKHLQTGTTTVYEWVNTGTTYAPSDSSEKIAELEQKIADQAESIKNLQAAVENGFVNCPLNREEALNLIRDWNKPIYDTTDIVLFDTEKPAINNSKLTVDAVYAAYDALMAKYPAYVTKTLLGNASDGVTPIYRYDFQAPKPHEYSGGINPDIERPKAILLSGIHSEWTGIWSPYYALEEILINPELRDVKTNCHLIVVPLVNPYCLLPGNYDKTNGRKNANGVEIHRNFAVEHQVISSSSNNYGGKAPLSEVESQYIDQIMKSNSDAAFMLSAHNFDNGGGKDYGTSFIWASTATNYLYNLSGRFVVNMSYAWEDKYGDTFRANIDANKSSIQPAGDYTVGMIGRSTTPGTEAKHAMLYGIHAATLEVGGDMVALGGATNSSMTLTRGAEVYANYIKTAFNNFDCRDKTDYAPILAGNMVN